MFFFVLFFYESCLCVLRATINTSNGFQSSISKASGANWNFQRKGGKTFSRILTLMLSLMTRLRKTEIHTFVSEERKLNYNYSISPYTQWRCQSKFSGEGGANYIGLSSGAPRIGQRDTPQYTTGKKGYTTGSCQRLRRSGGRAIGGGTGATLAPAIFFLGGP